MVLVAGAVSSGCVPVSGSSASVVEIGIHHSRFEIPSLEVEAGTTVRFVLNNSDPIDHEFIVGNKRVQAVHERGTEAHHAPRPGEVSVPAGSTRTTTYTFEDPGTLIFGCHLPGHYAYGMRGQIVVA
jgi:uncharacterized cupredoxin-like copper-binding protein